jgi:signal transduction histidine kinase
MTKSVETTRKGRNGNAGRSRRGGEDHMRAWVSFLAFTLIYFLAAVLGLNWATVQGAGSSVWPAAAIGFAGLMLGGLRLWPAIFVGRIAAALVSGSTQPLWAECFLALANVAGAVLAVLITRKAGGFDMRLAAGRDVLRFLLLGAVPVALISATMGAATLAVSSGLSAEQSVGVWGRWASTNFASVAILGALILSVAAQPLRFSGAQAAHLTMILVATAAFSALVFLSHDQINLRTWHAYPFLIWAAMTFGTRGAALALLPVAVLAVLSVSAGTGPFVDVHHDPVTRMMVVQQFLGITGPTILLLAAVSDERRRAEELEAAQQQLTRKTQELERLNHTLEDQVEERTRELKRSEESLRQSQKMDAVGQLTGGIAHDFNNLLTPVIGGLDMIVKKTAEPKTKWLAENALQAAERGGQITSRLLAFSRSQQLDIRPLQVARLVSEMRGLLRSAAGPNVTLELQLEDNEVYVTGDRTQLELSLMNLVINARDAMPNGGKCKVETRLVGMQTDTDLADGDYVELGVSDTGTGMPEDVAERIFEPFFTTKDQGKGTGLGLSLVYGVAKQSGGTVRFETAEGEGTTVRIYLPVAVGTLSSVEIAPAVATPAKPPATGRILVVDDDDEVRSFVVASLSADGHEVLEAADGSTGLQVFDTGHFDLVMLDFAMPGMNGAEMAKAMRSSRPTQKIIFITGYASSEAIEAAAADARILRKPFRSEDVLGAVAAEISTLTH